MLDRIRQDRIRFLGATRLGQDHAETGQDVESPLRRGGQQRCGPPEEIAGHQKVEGSEGARACRREQLASSLGERGRVQVSGPELLSEVHAALEVSGGGLVDVWLIRILLQHPIREALVQIGPELLGKTSVHGLSNERVCEAPPFAGLIIALKQTAPFERRDRIHDIVEGHVWPERKNRFLPETSSLDRGPFQE